MVHTQYIWHFFFYLIGPLADGPPIFLKFGMVIPLGALTNSLDGFLKILKIAYFTGVQSFEILKIGFFCFHCNFASRACILKIQTPECF